MRKQKVLVVEADPELPGAHALMLEPEGYELLSAASGAEALAVAAAERPDLVLLDATLPEVDAVEFCRRLKAEEGGAFVVMLSGPGTTAEQQAEALRTGADGYLAKPIEPAALR